MGVKKKIFAAFIAVSLVAALILGVTGRSRPTNFLWEVSSDNGGRIYILGSIHLAYPGLYPLDKEIYEAFNQAGALVVELNTEEMPPSMIEDYLAVHGLSNDPRPLPERLSPVTRDALITGGFYEPRLDVFRPWLAALVIQVEALRKNGFEARYGLDRHFIERAWEKKLDIIELETMDEQMGILADMSENEADLFLRAALLEMEDLPSIMNEFLDTWKNGDASGFAAVFFKEYDRYPELRPLMDKVIFQRNEQMAVKIDVFLRQTDRVLFVVIGAGHLVGDRSVLTDLAARGHAIKQL